MDACLLVCLCVPACASVCSCPTSKSPEGEYLNPPGNDTPEKFPSSQAATRDTIGRWKQEVHAELPGRMRKIGREERVRGGVRGEGNGGAEGLGE